MFHKRLLSLAALLVLLVFPVSAYMVSVMVIETGLTEDVSSLPHASVWEGGLMDALFESGHIATNNPQTRAFRKPAQDFSGIFEDDYFEAKAGGVEYFILCYLEYQNRNGVPAPVKIEIKLYRIDPKRLVFEQSFPLGSGSDNSEEYKIAKTAGQRIISQIKD